MPDNNRPYDQIRKTILAIYSAPTERPHFINLARFIEEWDEKEFSEKESEGLRIFEDLQSLSAFLESKGLSAQSDEVFRLILHTFPEKYFPSLPWLKESEDIDFKLMDDAGFVIQSRNYPDYVQEAFRLFNEQFRKVNRKLPAFAKEVELNLFKERGSGDAGELFRRFADLAEKLQETTMKDVPWTLIKQLAMKMNNTLNAFNASYLLLKSLDEVKKARPSPGLRDNMLRNEKFFLRNYYWKSIDESQAKKDHTNLVFFIDKYLPMVDTGYERSNLLMMRDKALKEINEIPTGFVNYTLIGFALLVIVSILLSEPEQKKTLNLDRVRRQILVSKRGADNILTPEDESANHEEQLLQSALEVKSRTGLRERKPPVRPHNRKLNIYEIRHVIFQKMRIDYLKEQKLDPLQEEKLAELIDDYNKRCEFYDYEPEVREKVHWDAKIYAPRIVQDAQDMIESWKKKDVVQEFFDQSTDQLLSLSNPAHVQAIIKRLKLYGYYKEKEIPSVWNESAKRALLDFKVSNLAIVDSTWDLKTQKVLFGQ
jgi:hypothetical protein